jgi:hypothetical protein
MISSMILIEEILLDQTKVKFFNGIDFNVIMKHSKDGSGGFIFCFIENWVTEVKKWERESKINSVINNEQFEKFKTEELDNNYIAIYQLEGTEPGVLFEVIKEKVINKNFPEHPWIPISGLNKGSWKIGKNGLHN